MHAPLLGAILASLALGPCAFPDPTEPSAAQPAVDTAPRAVPRPLPPPRVILLRGALGVFSRGLDALAARCRSEGMSVSVYPYTQWSSIADGLVDEPSAPRAPLVLIGHSFGADAVLAIANRLRGYGRHVDLTVTLESVVHTAAPDNIAAALNFYSGRTKYSPIPLWRGLPLAQTANVENINLRERRDIAPRYTGHGNIDDSAEVHQYVLARIHALTAAEKADAATADPRVQPTMQGGQMIVEQAPRLGPDAAPPTMSLRIATPETSTAVAPSPTTDEPLAIPGPVPGAASGAHAAAQGDSGYSPTALLRRPPGPAIAERGGEAAAVPAQPTSQGRR